MSDVTALLAEAAWLTRLARSLVGSDDADDVVQETYAAALRTPPDPDLPARPWLRRVMVNVVRMRHRGRVRRDTREQASMIAEPVPSPEQLLVRARVERTLADLVIALDEPLRSTVLLRYREGLSAEAIAAQQQVSVATVRRRLSEAVEYLRAGMDERETSKTWRAAFAPFLVGREPSPPIWSLIMAKAATKFALVAIALLLLVVGGGVAIHHSRATATNQEKAVPRGGSSASITVGTLARVFVQPGVATQQLVGRVTLDNRGFSGAQVRVTHTVTHEMIAEVASGPDGAFSIPNVPAASVVVSAIAKEKTAMPVIVDMRSPAERSQTVELRLVDCLHIRGIVSDGSGAPISHAHIAPELAQVPFADTDMLGRYDVCAHAGSQSLRVAASGYHAVVVDVMLGSNTIQDITLLPEATLAGMVIDSANRPVADAAITVDPRGLSTVRNAKVIARSEADGTFRITGVAPGRNELYAEAPGLSSRRIGVVLGAGETREGIVLRLDHAPRLAGKVKDSHGQPASGASIGLRVGSEVREGLAVTQADGSFVIERAPKGTHSIVIPWYEVGDPREVTIGDKDATIAITADPLPVITGIVTRGGAPLPNAILQCPMMNRDVAPVTDAAGAFTCPLLQEGPFSVYASDSSGRFGGVDGAWKRGQALAPITIELDQAGAICGAVSDQNGAKLRGIRIRADNPAVMDMSESTSDEQGGYCIRQLRNEGTFEMTAWSGGQMVSPVTPLPRVTLVKGKATLDIVLAAPDQAIEGVVVDDVGAPMPDASVRVTAEQYFSSLSNVAVSDASGHFSVQRLAAGSYQVLATARDGASKTMASVTAGTRNLRIVLERAGSIEGTLIGFHSQPSILGTLASFGQEPVDFEVEGDHFRAHGLPPGNYMITASTNGHEADNTTVAVKAGSTTPVVLTSRGSASVSGHVIDWTTKQPVANARCAPPLPRDGDNLGTFMRAPEIERATDVSGAFHFDDVTAGEISIPCDAAATHAIRSATIAADSHAQVDVYVVTGRSGGGDVGAIDGLRAMVSVQSNAAKAGLHVGDIVTAIDNQSVELLDGYTVRNAISTHAVGTAMSLTVRRSGLLITLEITL